MDSKERAKLDLKIANEEYGEPDFAPVWVVVTILGAIVSLGALIWFLWTYLQTPASPTC